MDFFLVKTKSRSVFFDAHIRGSNLSVKLAPGSDRPSSLAKASAGPRLF